MNAQINIKPEGMRVSANGNPMDAQDAVALIENGSAAGYSIRVELSGNGYTMHADVERAALKAAGLTGFAAAKQTARGFIRIN